MKQKSLGMHYMQQGVTQNIIWWICPMTLNNSGTGRMPQPVQCLVDNQPFLDNCNRGLILPRPFNEKKINK